MFPDCPRSVRDWPFAPVKRLASIAFLIVPPTSVEGLCGGLQLLVGADEDRHVAGEGLRKG